MSKSWLVVLGLSSLVGCSAGREVLGSYGATDAGPDLSVTNDGAAFDVGPCAPGCSLDGRSVLDPCRGTEKKCAANETCQAAECLDACALADKNQSSVGCDYYAVSMDIHPELRGSCFVALVTNTFGTPAHVGASFHDVAIDLGKHAAIPHGSGNAIEYELYDPKKGIEPGQVLIVFLEQFGGVRCPVPAARSTGGSINGSGFGQAFHVTSDVPVVAYQMLPYGGGSAAVTGASLLLPTSAWGHNYGAATAWPDGTPSLDIVAAEEGTTVSILPKVDIVGREGLLEGAKAGVTAKYVLGKGEVLQLTQSGDLTGSPIEADKKIALFAGHPCMNVPAGVGYCDHGEQQIPPVFALGNEYVAAPHRPRIDGDVTRRWRLVGVVDDTKLTFDPPGLYPSSLKLGDAIEITSESAFVVKSQDGKHPFLLFSYMTGADLAGGYGDPEFVRMVSPAQYLDRYVFLTDPSYPETSLVVVRKKGESGFADVELDCAGKLGGWKPIGEGGQYERTVADLVRHDFEPQGACDNGVHRMSSSAPFGVWVWGWGGPETSGGSCGPFEPGAPPPGVFTCDVSYGFPAGESVRSINDVVVPSRPR
jgi:hypothetical protein